MSDEFEDLLKKQENKARENLHKDVGHLTLIADIGELWTEATGCQFHDMLNQKYATPKQELVAKLETMIDRAKSGIYDNIN